MKEQVHNVVTVQETESNKKGKETINKHCFFVNKWRGDINLSFVKMGKKTSLKT